MTGGVGELLDRTIEEFRCRFDNFESSMRELSNRVEQIQGGIARLEQLIMLPTRSNTINQPRPEVADHEDLTKRIQGSDTTDDHRLYPQLEKAHKNKSIASGSSSSTSTTTSEGPPPRTLSRPSSVEQFEVFLSFSGDTRKGFTSYLYDALDKNGVRTFMDSERLEQGGFLMEDLYKAIEASTMAIVVFSNKYADSKWCLNELAKIVECKLFLLPIFYNVEPTEVRNQSGSFGVPFGNHEKVFPANQVEGWRQALRLAGERAGFKNDANGNEPKLIEKVIGKVVQELNRIRPPQVPPTSELSGKTALSCKERIVELLQNQNQGVHKIGVWGAGGVGKTCIVRNVYKELQSGIITNNPFDCIYYVEVPYDSDWRDVRKEIKKQVFLRMVVPDEDNDFRAADSLNRRLRGSKFLLILDDLWRSIDLQALGIPEPNQENGCKVLFTTRNYEVCSSMGTQADVKVNTLPWDEAWEFFSQRAGDIPNDIVELGIDKGIARLCGGIPIGLLEVAEFLRKETMEHSWFVAHDHLRKGIPLSDRMKKQVFDRLRLSYDRLESEVLKECFLVSAFYIVGDPYTRDMLVRDLVVEGFGRTWEDTRIKSTENEVSHCIVKLQKASLLDETKNAYANSVHIEGLMRRVAFQIIGSSKLVWSYRTLRYAPQQEAWEKAERIALMCSSITTLPPNPSCPNLISLTVRGSKNIRHIPDTFFQHMERLCVLDLGETSITRFPTSLSKLVNLRYLTGDYVPLKSIEGVGGLKSLVYLNLSYSAVKCLPSEISELSNLRGLCLRNTEHLTEIPKDAICGLSSLEVLFIVPSAYVWSTKTTRENAGLQELESLPLLYQFEFIVGTGEDFEHVKSLAAEKWSRFNLGCHVRERNETMKFDRIAKAWTMC